MSRCRPLAANESPIASLVLSRWDYGNAALSSLPPDYGIVVCSPSSMQRQRRSSIYGRGTTRVTPFLIEPHWLIADDPVSFEVAMLVYRFLHDLARPYLSSSLHCVTRDIDSGHQQRFRLVPAGYCWRSFVSRCRAVYMKQSAGNSIVAAVIQTKA